MSTVLICEGYNDKMVLHETTTNHMGINPDDIKTYSKLKLFNRDLGSNRLRNISVISLDGAISPKFPAKFVRDFWYIGAYTLSIGFISDLDRGDLFEKMYDYLQSYLNQECKRHNINPEITCAKSNKKLKMYISPKKTIFMWTLGVPESLEIQIACALKGKFQGLKLVNDEDDTIHSAISLTKSTREDVLRLSVDLLSGKNWFKNLCAKFNNRFVFP